ncbi:MAG: molybdopterin-dependent oxidoreductase [Polyangiales bacterium]
MEIPHYCWHPGLPIAANCRMCLVEIEPGPNQRAMMLDVLKWDAAKNDWVADRKPKLQPACQITAAEGMVVRSATSPHVAEARAHVQEFLLVNHPVDCPICDQAGECKLQDYWLSEQGTYKRMRDEPVHKPKGVPFGPKIVYDAERCIACTRCVRVCDELMGEHLLELRERGNKFEITLAPGRTLDNHYALMTEHVCPVGALTSSHFRFKARVWTLKETATVCPGCATGCNAWVDVDPREARAYRNRPRDNTAVNGYWMCDDGMMTYLRQHESRVTHATAGRGDKRARVTVDEGIARAAEALKHHPQGKVAVMLSAQASTEDNFVLVELARQLGAPLFLSARPPWDGDKVLRHSDQNPNRAGAVAVSNNAHIGTMKDLVTRVSNGEFEALVGLGVDADVELASLAPLGQLPQVVLLATHDGPLARYATVLLPKASWVESPGSFMNFKGVAQGFDRALRPEGDAAPGWDLVARLGRAMSLDLAYKKLKDVRAAIAVLAPAASTEHRPPEPGLPTPITSDTIVPG